MKDRPKRIDLPVSYNRSQYCEPFLKFVITVPTDVAEMTNKINNILFLMCRWFSVGDVSFVSAGMLSFIVGVIGRAGLTTEVG